METKQVIVMRKDLNMRKGKMCAQAAHASLGIFTHRMKMTAKRTYRIEMTEEMESWLMSSFKKVTVGVDNEENLLEIYALAQKAGLPTVLITDSGLTEFNGVPTNTCIAIGPARAEEIDKITGGLKLL